MQYLFDYVAHFIAGLGKALLFLFDVLSHIVRGKIRFGEVLKQIYEQGIQTVVVIVLTSLASGMVLAMQGYVTLSRLGGKEAVAQLVALSLVRELSPVFSCFIYSGKAGARMTAELASMSVNDQILAARTLGVNPMELLIVPRMIACFIVVPILVVLSEIVGITGGYLIGVFEANIPGSYYINQTMASVDYVDFFSGFIKTFFFAIIIGWVCCYQGFHARGGSLGVGKYTTKAVALSYILVVLSDAFLTRIILTFWG